jgi:diaminopimelate dehydrogenase
MKIKIGICGYGNLGRGVEAELTKNPDMEAVAVFSRRELATLSGLKSVLIQNVAEWQDKIDVMLLCGGSASDLPTQGPQMAALFNTVDSYDTHAKIPEYKAVMDAAARASGKTAVISTGWDPGLFSLMRLYFGAVIPDGKSYSFWGDGVSQGHGEALRRVPGVADGVQYTRPVKAAVERVLSGEQPNFTTREKHTRECYVVAEDGADRAEIARQIKEMPHYFADYDTTVQFITAEELARDHGTLPHGGRVIHSGVTGADNNQVLEFSLKLASNPEFTASVMIAYARAAYRMAQMGQGGAFTVFGIPPVLLSPHNLNDLVRDLL